MINSNHLNYLQSVNNLSIKNIGLTGKNPSVACLIVDYSKSSKGIILSYGLTSKNGRPHAEINAINKLSKKEINNKTVMYISLEPCFKNNSCCAKAIVKAGIKKVLIPIENKKDLVEVPKTILDSIEVIPVKNIDEVLKVALTKPFKRVEWVEVDQLANKSKTKDELSTH